MPEWCGVCPTGVEGAARGCAPSTISVVNSGSRISGLEVRLAEGLEKTLKGTGMVEEGENGKTVFDPQVGYVIRAAFCSPGKLGADHWLPPLCFGA